MSGSVDSCGRGGDLYYTDCEVWILRLVEDCRKDTEKVTIIPSPPATELKDQIWRTITQAFAEIGPSRPWNRRRITASMTG